MTPWQKILCASALFLVWAALVVFSDAPQSQFIQAIRDALVALGVFAATKFNPKG